jgi:hypothetical protein
MYNKVGGPLMPQSQGAGSASAEAESAPSIPMPIFTASLPRNGERAVTLTLSDRATSYQESKVLRVDMWFFEFRTQLTKKLMMKRYRQHLKAYSFVKEIMATTKEK